MAVSGPWRKLLTVSLPAALLVAGGVMGGIELWVRTLWDTRKGVPGFFLSDAARGQRLAAGYDGWFAGVPVHINSVELRDPREYGVAKRSNTFRILVLGDSVTFGHGSVYEQTYPYLLEQRLKVWRSDVDWQVWNAAVPGYNTSQELAHLLEVGDRFKPDLVVVGFFENDLIGNYPVRPPGRLWTLAVRGVSVARRYLYSLELYKKLYLTLAWRISASDDYRRRLEHLGTEESLLDAADKHALKEPALTPFDHLTDAQVREVNCVYGMKPNPGAVAAMQRESSYGEWLDAVRGLQELHRAGRYRIMFFINDAPPVCPDEDVFYDGGSNAVDDFYMRVLGANTPVVSSYDAYRHVRPSQMPAAGQHSIGNANVVKADVLFEFLRDRILPGVLPAPDDRGSRP